MDSKDVFEAIKLECQTAMNKFPPFNSAHEGLAVIEEEFEELKKEVFKSPSNRDFVHMKDETVQLGAMALRFLIDCC